MLLLEMVWDPNQGLMVNEADGRPNLSLNAKNGAWLYFKYKY